MSPNLTNVLTAVEALTPAEREELIDHLLLEEDLLQEESRPPVLSEAWMQEIARRSAEYDAGLVQGVPWEEIQARWAVRRAAGG